jgi:menaquinone-specific isochorismate synthase
VFVGASPELLVARRGLSVRCHPQAGTVARSGDSRSDEAMVQQMLGSAKQRREHRVVVEEVASKLRPLCSELRVPDTPSVVLLRNVSHLATPIEGELLACQGQPDEGAERVAGPTLPAGMPAAGAGVPSALGLATLLHPTPAVAGMPMQAALALMASVEGMDRGPYAGPVGWVDARGDGDWVVGIRSATLAGATARLVAGVGVVAGSEPRDELAETQLKLLALLAAVVRT